MKLQPLCHTAAVRRPSPRALFGLVCLCFGVGLIFPNFYQHNRMTVMQVEGLSNDNRGPARPQGGERDEVERKER